MNSKLVIPLTIACILLALATFSSCSIAYRTKVARDKEMMARLELEERISQVPSAQSTQGPDLTRLQEQYSEVRSAHEATQKALVGEQIANQGLREQVEELTYQLKTLESRLQEALIAD